MNLSNYQENIGCTVSASLLYKKLGYSELRNFKKVILNNKFLYVNSKLSAPSIKGGRPSEDMLLRPIDALKVVALSKNSGHIDSKKEIMNDLISCLEIEQIIKIIDLINSIDVEDVPIDRYIYAAIEEKSKRIKIGISKNPEDRINQLNTGNPETLKLVYKAKAVENGYRSETLAHAIFSEHRLKGEWFASGIDLNILNEKIGKNTINKRA